VLNPRIGIPFRIADLVEVLPEVGYYGTFYHTDGQSAEERSLFTAMLDTRIRLRREVDLPFGQGRGVHLMEPRLVYTGVTNASQSDNPLFIPRPRTLQERIRQFELFNVTRDPSDRIDSVNAITAGLGNRFYVPGEEGEPPDLFADVSLSTQYEFGDNDLGNFYLEGTVYPYERIQVRFNMGWDFEETEFSEGLLEARYSSEKGLDLAFSYRYLRDIPRFFESFTAGDENRYDEFEEGFQRINQIGVRGRLPVTRNWAVSYRLRYSFENGILLTNRAGVEYISKCRCWAVLVEVGDDRSGGVDFNFRYVLIGLGDDDVRPFAGGTRRATRDDPYAGAQY
jgi:lipopolysaccharide assembly outer membrane protein LptD (OstA)